MHGDTGACALPGLMFSLVCPLVVTFITKNQNIPSDSQSERAGAVSGHFNKCATV